jgi:hypothetical protein
MGFAAALPLVGQAISGIAGVIGGNQQKNAQNRQAAAAQGMIQTNPSSIETLLSQYLGKTGLPNFNAQNTATDPIMQALLNSSGTAAANKSNATYSGIINNGGNQFDLSALFSALQGQQAQTQTRGVAAINANSGSFGRRYGSAGQMGVGDYLAQTDTNFNAQKQQIAQSSFNDAQNRIFQAAAGLGQNAQGQNSSLLQGLGLSQQGSAQQASFITNLLQLLGSNMNSRLNRNASLLGVANPTGPNPLTAAIGDAGNALAIAPTLTGLLGSGSSGMPSIPKSPVINSPYLNGLG